MRINSLNTNHPPVKRSRYKRVLWILSVLTAILIFLILSGYYKEKYPQSYLPESRAGNLKLISPDEKKLALSNPWYKLEVDRYGEVSVKATGGEMIMSRLVYYSDYEGMGERYGLDDVAVEVNSDSTILILGTGEGGVLINLQLTVSKHTPDMDVTINTFYVSTTTVRRVALIAKFDVPISEVYLKNRKIDVEPFDREYWLQKQGVRFGRDSISALIYHTPDISSLQLNSNKKLLVLNLEYYLDHPLIYIPYQENGAGKWVDHSAALYNQGMERANHFSLYFGCLPKITPRLMLVPGGYLAGYVFTEHADGGNIRTQRAAYFGSENISVSTNATGGFVGHKIPVTKSVFYDELDGGLSESSADDDEESQYLNFLDHLYATGLYDLCLHTPEDTNSNRAYLAEAIKFMKERYDTRTWIDHGMFSGKSNRETFVCDGLDPNSEFYSADLWDKYDTRYFWSSAVEKIRVSVPEVSLTKELWHFRMESLSAELWRRYRFLNIYQGKKVFSDFTEILKGYFPTYELNSLQQFKGNSYPTPLYWQNITRTKQFYSWATDFVQSGISPVMADDQLRTEKKQLDLLLENWGVYINHGYFVRNRIDDNILCEKNGELVINPYFDQILSYLDQIRDDGNLFITTIRDLLDYWILLENISFEYQPNGIINIYNNNKLPVKGLSLVLNTDARSVRIDGKIPSCKQIKEDAVIWFDMQAESHSILQLIENDVPIH